MEAGKYGPKNGEQSLYLAQTGKEPRPGGYFLSLWEKENGPN